MYIFHIQLGQQRLELYPALEEEGETILCFLDFQLIDEYLQSEATSKNNPLPESV